jgi:hypothetical protein
VPGANAQVVATEARSVSATGSPGSDVSHLARHPRDVKTPTNFPSVRDHPERPATRARYPAATVHLPHWGAVALIRHVGRCFAASSGRVIRGVRVGWVCSAAGWVCGATVCGCFGVSKLRSRRGCRSLGEVLRAHTYWRDGWRQRRGRGQRRQRGVRWRETVAAHSRLYRIRCSHRIGIKSVTIAHGHDDRHASHNLSRLGSFFRHPIGRLGAQCGLNFNSRPPSISSSSQTLLTRYMHSGCPAAADSIFYTNVQIR